MFHPGSTYSAAYSMAQTELGIKRMKVQYRQFQTEDQPRHASEHALGRELQHRAEMAERIKREERELERERAAEQRRNAQRICGFRRSFARGTAIRKKSRRIPKSCWSGRCAGSWIPADISRRIESIEIISVMSSCSPMRRSTTGSCLS